MRKSYSALLPLIGALLAAGAFGAAAAAAAVAFASEHQLAQAQRETANAVARAKLLESVIRRQAEHAVSLVGSPELASADLQTPAATTGLILPAAPSQSSPSAVPTAAAANPVPASAKPPIKPEQKVVERRAAATATNAPVPATKVAMAAAVQQSAPGAAPNATPAVAVTPPQTTAASVETDVLVVTPDVVAAARKNNRIEGVDGSKLGVVKLDPSGVELKNGRTIHPGGKFPSGERLLAIDQTNGQIVTDRRTILVF